MNLSDPKLLDTLLSEYPVLKNKLSIVNTNELSYFPDLPAEYHYLPTQRQFNKAIAILVTRNPPAILFYHNSVIALRYRQSIWSMVVYREKNNTIKNIQYLQSH